MNKNVFKSTGGSRVASPAGTTNESGGKAYSLTSEAALATLAATGTFNNTFYATAGDQLQKFQEMAGKCSTKFLAQTALYARESAFMKDTPALLCAILSTRGEEGRTYLQRIFPRVINNGKMLRNFVQTIRSGAVGRKSLGSAPKNLVRGWLQKDPNWIFKQSVGQSPSLGDIVKMVHPRPETPEQEALYGYLIGRDTHQENLPSLIKQFEAYKKGLSTEVPEVDFRMLTALDLGPEQWTAIARNGGWHFLRMNINTLKRHGVFENPEMVTYVANRLKDQQEISRARVFPYQLMMAYKAAEDAPRPIIDALHDAMEIATQNIPQYPGKVYIFPDVSGSMSSPVTGDRGNATSKVTCTDVAALFAASILRRNPDATVIPYDVLLHLGLRLEPRDTVATNARKLAVGGGGTASQLPLAYLNKKKANADLVIYISDNQSWIQNGMGRGLYSTPGTEMMKQWVLFKARNPKAKLVCIDIQPYTSTQTPDRNDILNIASFSDQVFEVIRVFAAGNTESWVEEIRKIDL